MTFIFNLRRSNFYRNQSKIYIFLTIPCMLHKMLKKYLISSKNTLQVNNLQLRKGFFFIFTKECKVIFFMNFALPNYCLWKNLTINNYMKIKKKKTLSWDEHKPSTYFLMIFNIKKSYNIRGTVENIVKF